ncbi:hypothetical protein Tco_0486626 [Tanacetum coccineum]
MRLTTTHGWPNDKGACDYDSKMCEEGYLETNPSTSPEHMFVAPDGKPNAPVDSYISGKIVQLKEQIATLEKRPYIVFVQAMLRCNQPITCGSFNNDGSMYAYGGAENHNAATTKTSIYVHLPQVEPKMVQLVRSWRSPEQLGSIGLMVTDEGIMSKGLELLTGAKKAEMEEK